MKRCIVNYFSNGRENYAVGSKRLVESLAEVNYKGDILVFSPNFTEEDEKTIYQFNEDGNMYAIKGMPVTEQFGPCPSHETHPYAFKVYCIQNAIERGYQQVAWMDSSVVFLKNPDWLFNLSNEIGVVLFDNQGCPENIWTSDDCLEQLGIKPEDADFFEVEAAMQFYDFSRKKARDIFNEYMKYCNDGICLKGASGSNRPEFRAHRHDQSIISGVAKKMCVTFLNYGAWCLHEDALLNPEYNPTLAKIGVNMPLDAIKDYIRKK